LDYYFEVIFEYHLVTKMRIYPDPLNFLFFREYFGFFLDQMKHLDSYLL